MKHAELPAVTQCLMRGRARIAAGWLKGMFGPGAGGKVCAVGAIIGEEIDVLRRLRSALPEPWYSVIAYNDHRATTQADILALYDRAIQASLNEG